MRALRTVLFTSWWVGASVLVCPGLSSAEDPFEAASPESEAKVLREEGLEHFKKKQYAESVEAFQKALARQRTAGAMAQMASALNALGRYDEALRWYETVLAEFPTASEKLRKTVKAEMTDLVSKVGTISVSGDIIAGARLLIDSRDVGALPLERPVHVLAGVHEVRAEKSGFAPIKVVVEVSAGKSTIAKLEARERQAKLDIHEKHNWVMHVEIDGIDVGLTPLSKKVSVGEHRIRLRGFMRPDALLACESPEEPVDMGARMESEEKVVTLGLFETQTVDLSAEDVDAALKLDSAPRGAIVMIDYGQVGLTPWEGRLPLGEHVIEVNAKGYFGAKQTVTLERRKQQNVSVVLEREPDRAGEARAARNVKIGLAVAYGLGGVGLGMFAIGGGLALQDSRRLEANCPNRQCPSTEAGTFEHINTFGALSTAGITIAGIGIAAGTTIFFLTRPPEPKHSAAPSVGVSVGPGGMAIAGKF